MKLAHLTMAAALVALTACKVIDNPHGPKPVKPVKDTPETVMVTYHVQAGREVEFAALLGRAFDAYQHNHLVRGQPHVIVQTREADGKPKFVEIFTWVSHAAPNKAIASIQALWAQETALCEDRNGHRSLEGGEVALIAP